MLFRIQSRENNKLHMKSIKLWGFSLRKKQLKNKSKEAILEASMKWLMNFFISSSCTLQREINKIDLKYNIFRVRYWKNCQNQKAIVWWFSKLQSLFQQMFLRVAWELYALSCIAPMDRQGQCLLTASAAETRFWASLSQCFFCILYGQLIHC